MHYQRWRTKGGVAPGGERAFSREEAFGSRTERRGDCLIWTGGKTAGGYGAMNIKGHVYAHRYAWERLNGPIPPGVTIDHKCHNPSCVEVSHLRPASTKQNAENRRGAQVNSTTGYRGVYRRKSGRYHARVKHGGKVHLLGMYDTAEEAAEAASNKRRELFTHYLG